jgi:hypothetical protein
MAPVERLRLRPPIRYHCRAPCCPAFPQAVRLCRYRLGMPGPPCWHSAAWPGAGCGIQCVCPARRKGRVVARHCRRRPGGRRPRAAAEGAAGGCSKWGRVVEVATAFGLPLPALRPLAVAALAGALDLGRGPLEAGPDLAASSSVTERWSPSGVSQLRWRSRPVPITRSDAFVGDPHRSSLQSGSLKPSARQVQLDWPPPEPGWRRSPRLRLGAGRLAGADEG